MKEYRGVRLWLNLNLALDGGECLKERGYLEVLGVDGSIILKWILNRMGEHGLDSSV
jgi:hypothetical protein